MLPEREVIKEERRQRTDNDPANRLGEQLDAALYLAHPYGKPVIGWMSEMSELAATMPSPSTACTTPRPMPFWSSPATSIRPR